MDTYLQQFFRYIKSERGYSPNTLAAYKRDLAQFKTFVEGTGAARLDKLDPEELDDFVVSLQDMGYRTSTVARKVAATRSFLRFLYAEGVVEQDLLDWLRQPKIEKRLPKTLSRDQVERLIQAASLEDQPGSQGQRDSRRYAQIAPELGLAHQAVFQHMHAVLIAIVVVFIDTAPGICVVVEEVVGRVCEHQTKHCGEPQLPFKKPGAPGHQAAQCCRCEGHEQDRGAAGDQPLRHWVQHLPFAVRQLGHLLQRAAPHFYVNHCSAVFLWADGSKLGYTDS